MKKYFKKFGKKYFDAVSNIEIPMILNHAAIVVLNFKTFYVVRNVILYDGNRKCRSPIERSYD